MSELDGNERTFRVRTSSEKTVPKLWINSAIDQQFWLSSAMSQRAPMSLSDVDDTKTIFPLKLVFLPTSKHKACARASRASVLTEDKELLLEALNTGLNTIMLCAYRAKTQFVKRRSCSPESKRSQVRAHKQEGHTAKTTTPSDSLPRRDLMCINEATRSKIYLA